MSAAALFCGPKGQHIKVEGRTSITCLEQEARVSTEAIKNVLSTIIGPMTEQEQLFSGRKKCKSPTAGLKSKAKMRYDGTRGVAVDMV